MVRLLLLSTIFLSSLAYAHDASMAAECEGWLNPAQKRTYAFLKKLQAEVEQVVPAETHTRVAVGRSLGPLAAAMRQAGTQVASVPLELNFRSILKGEAKGRLWKLFDTFMPQMDEVGKKPVVIMLYAEDAKQALALYHMAREYYGDLGKPAGWIDIRVYTTQMHARHFTEQLVQGFDGLPGIIADHRNVRPIAAANEVRHWFHDGMHPTRFDHSEFSVVDVFDTNTPIPLQRTAMRENFAQLVLTLANPNL